MTRFLITGVSGLLGLNLALFASNNENVFGTVYSHELKNVPFIVPQWQIWMLAKRSQRLLNS